MPGSTWIGHPVPDGEPIARLRELCSSSSESRWAAFVALADTPGEEALDVLVEFCRSHDPHVRRAAVEGVGAHELGKRAAAVVVRLLRDQSDFVQRTACDVAGRLGISSAREAIHELRLAESAHSRETAVAALARLWRDEDFDALVGQYQSDPSASVRKRTAWTLREVSAATHVPTLFELWRGDPVPRHRAWACELAEAHPDPRYRDALEELVEDVDGHVRSAAARAIGAVEER